MSKHLFSMNKDDEEYFNSKLYFALKKYNKSSEENNSNEEIEQKLNFQNLNNDNFTLQECISKDLLETIDSLIPINELKKEDNNIDNLNLDETNDSSILFRSSLKIQFKMIKIKRLFHLLIIIILLFQKTLFLESKEEKNILKEDLVIGFVTFAKI